ncbi:cytochrome b/b6 domain-containing protein [Arcobacter sp. FWKO B]|uniref:cytochrome b/b6 domain-containing protein n=1 Tax=Arcobacter sp. FWKO B TaxID=2593672 RepID=UPI0018A5DE50|nr:cytochrome b/b6 domain-containing protein [Arcobacter sp. FWKO B]QOG11650.1 cytochrome b/b6 domain-containing protein [Arcobacter sp. FWKO B]
MKIQRQSISNRVVHALTAISIFGLFFTGFGQMPVYKRYMLNEVPFMAWSADYHITLWWHYLFSVILIGVAFYHLTYHLLRKEYDILPKKGDVKHSAEVIKAMVTGKEEPPSEKYLPEQRLGYAFIAFWIVVMIITGIIKVIKNVSGINMSLEVLFWTAQIHNLGFMMLILGVMGHLSAFLFKPNRRLLPAMLWGKICSCYAKSRHSKWEEGVKQSEEVLKKHGGDEACKNYKH